LPIWSASSPGILALPALAVEGLMTVGRLRRRTRSRLAPTFVALRDLSERLASARFRGSARRCRWA
jgi:hypothetical protein